jgi:hypothetical protein
VPNQDSKNPRGYSGSIKQQITTESGSVYLIDHEEKTWVRVMTTGMSGSLRSESGKFVRADIIGDRLYLLCEPLAEGGPGRLIHTSQICAMEDVADA